MDVTIKLGKKMKGEDVFDSSEQMWNKKFASLRLQTEREICHLTLPSWAFIEWCAPRRAGLSDGKMAGCLDGLPDRLPDDPTAGWTEGWMAGWPYCRIAG